MGYPALQLPFSACTIPRAVDGQLFWLPASHAFIISATYAISNHIPSFPPPPMHLTTVLSACALPLLAAAQYGGYGDSGGGDKTSSAAASAPSIPADTDTHKNVCCYFLSLFILSHHHPFARSSLPSTRLLHLVQLVWQQRMAPSLHFGSLSA